MGCSGFSSRRRGTRTWLLREVHRHPVVLDLRVRNRIATRLDLQDQPHLGVWHTGCLSRADLHAIDKPLDGLASEPLDGNRVPLTLIETRGPDGLVAALGRALEMPERIHCG